MTLPEKEHKRVGIWIRVSTEDQARGESPQHHEERAKFYAKAKDWKVIETYHLEAVSGKAILDHPETKRMLEDVKSGHINGLIFSKLARLARNTRELLDISDIFREHGADLISLQESIDTSTPAGRLFYTMIAAMAQWEREEISERVKASVPIRAKLGKPLGGVAQFGYRWEVNRLVLDEKEAPIRRLMFELFLKFQKKTTVARELNKRGYRTRRGGKWSYSSIRHLLEDPMAKGYRRANHKTTDGQDKPESEWVFSKVDPIVSEELWDQVNAILAKQAQSKNKPSRNAVNLFSGIVVCHCGTNMYIPSKSQKYTCAKCRNAIHSDDLESIYQEQLKSFLLSPDLLESYLSQADNTIQEKTDQLTILIAEKNKLIKEMDKLYSLYINDQISPDGFARNHEPLEERLKELEKFLPQLQSDIDYLKINFLSSNQIILDGKDLYRRWPEMSQEQKRSILDAITERIVVNEADISIDLHYLPFFQNDHNKSPNQPRFDG